MAGLEDYAAIVRERFDSGKPHCSRWMFQHVQKEYMGHKLHTDQNKKLGMFGVTHVPALVGFSSKIVAKATMAVKNNLVIYEEVYRAAVANSGMWDQLRVDHGREFYLALYM